MHTDTHPNYGLVSPEIEHMVQRSPKTFLHTGKNNLLHLRHYLYTQYVFLDHIHH